ncbi:hypothetical protein ABKV19_010164 [Rosa sericea]
MLHFMMNAGEFQYVMTIQLFELRALSGMLMDHNWTEIGKRRELLREAFSYLGSLAQARFQPRIGQFIDAESDRQTDSLQGTPQRKL